MMRFAAVLAVTAATVALGVSAAPAQAAPTTPTVVIPDSVLAFKVSPSSERSMRVCDLPDGFGLCGVVKPGHYSLFVASVESRRQDAGCELWESGVRKYKRQDHVTYRNFGLFLGKRTDALRNCRKVTGDVVNAGRA